MYFVSISNTFFISSPGITNATFHCSKVEDVISKIISSLLSSTETVEDIVAVVDPPRAGLRECISFVSKYHHQTWLIYLPLRPILIFIILCYKSIRRFLKGTPLQHFSVKYFFFTQNGHLKYLVCIFYNVKYICKIRICIELSILVASPCMILINKTKL